MIPSFSKFRILEGARSAIFLKNHIDHVLSYDDHRTVLRLSKRTF
jgi:hypothetical protein